MDLQYLSDTQGRHTAVVIPIDDWNNLTTKHQDLKLLEKNLSTVADEKALLVEEIKEAFANLALVKQGKLKARPAKDLLNEL